MPDYILDNNHLSAAIAKGATIRQRIYQLRRAGHRVGTCFPVICELEAGIEQTADPDAYRHRLRQLLSQVRIWPLDHRIARAYGQIYLALRRRGRSLSQVDMMLAALTRVMNLTLLSSDRDFEALPDIRSENWLS